MGHRHNLRRHKRETKMIVRLAAFIGAWLAVAIIGWKNPWAGLIFGGLVTAAMMEILR